MFSNIYYRLMKRFALPEMPAKGADFLLMDRKVIDAYRNNAEKNTSILGLILWLGFRQTSIEYVKQSRLAGRSKWTLSMKLKLFMDSIVSFSYAPIRFMSGIGLVMSLLGMGCPVAMLVGRSAGWTTAGIGFTALLTVLLFGQGMILLMLGLLGEYLWRTFDESRNRQPYIIEEHLHSAWAPESADSPPTP